MSWAGVGWVSPTDLCLPQWTRLNLPQLASDFSRFSVSDLPCMSRQLSPRTSLKKPVFFRRFRLAARQIGVSCFCAPTLFFLLFSHSALFTISVWDNGDGSHLPALPNLSLMISVMCETARSDTCAVLLTSAPLSCLFCTGYRRWLSTLASCNEFKQLLGT